MSITIDDHRDKNLPTIVELNLSGDRRRVEAEQFIQHCFKRAYGAGIQQFMPTLMSLYDSEQNIYGVLGLRSAKDGYLFLEQYLEHPVEQAIAAQINLPVARDGVVEVGNLAVDAPGGSRWLITALTAYLFAASSKWAVFTIGPILQNTFRRLGLELIDLGPADPTLLTATEHTSWGRYYRQKPRVMAGRVAHSHQVMQQQYAAQSILTRLWQHAGQTGSLAA